MSPFGVRPSSGGVYTSWSDSLRSQWPGTETGPSVPGTCTVRSGTHVASGVGAVGDGACGIGRVVESWKRSNIAPEGVVPPSGDLIWLDAT